MSGLRRLADIQAQADEAVLAEIRKGIEAGMTQKQIAAAMAMSESKLCRFLQKHGWSVIRTLTPTPAPRG